MPLRLAAAVLSLFVAGEVAAADAPPLAQLPRGATLAIGSVLGDEVTSLRSGPMVQRAVITQHRVGWDLDARIVALAKRELERGGRFNTVPLTLDAGQLTDIHDIGLLPPRSATLRREVLKQIEALGPVTGAAAYLVIGRATLSNDLDDTSFELGGYGLYQLTKVIAGSGYGRRGPYHCDAYARLRLHLIDAKRLHNLANRTLRVSVPVDWVAFQVTWDKLNERDLNEIDARLWPALDAALTGALRELGIEAAPPATP